MIAVQELNKRLKDLPKSEREAMAAALLKEWKVQEWDRQIEADLEAGKLDYLVDEVEADIAAGCVRPL